MELILTAVILSLLHAVVAVPNAHPLPTPPARLAARDSSVAETGIFTGGDYNVYSVTSISGYVEVAGHSLSAGGADALVGGIIVTEGTDGFIANGITISLATVTSTSSSSSSASTSSATAASTTSTSSGFAAATDVSKAAGVVLGGMVGLLML